MQIDLARPAEEAEEEHRVMVMVEEAEEGEVVPLHLEVPVLECHLFGVSGFSPVEAPALHRFPCHSISTRPGGIA